MHLNAALLVDYVSRHKTAEIILGKPFDQSAGSYTTERTSFGDRHDRQTAGEEVKNTHDEAQAVPVYASVGKAEYGGWIMEKL